MVSPAIGKVILVLFRFADTMPRDDKRLSLWPNGLLQQITRRPQDLED